MTKSLLPVLLAAAALEAAPALTIYNGGYAVVRDTLAFDLKPGVTRVTYAGATAQVEPDTVILRDVAGKAAFRILEQSYRNDPVSQAMLLSLFEGKEIDFVRRNDGRPDETVRGKVIRSGHVPGGGEVQPIVEVGGRLQFFLPGEPLFPSLGTDNVLKPTLGWSLQSEHDGRVEAEVAYLSNGFGWEASYNLVAPEKGDKVDLVGWVTMRNRSGSAFDGATVKLMAGDVNRVANALRVRSAGSSRDAMLSKAAEVVTEKSFDEFHLYSLANPVSFRDKETKQVEFVRATGVKADRIYVFEGSAHYGRPQTDPIKVQVYREFKNTEANRLGIALPKGKVRFYSQDTDRQLEFIGEDEVDHTPKNEKVRVFVGNSFDLVGEHRMTDSRSDGANRVEIHSFEIKLRNRKKEPVEIIAIEERTHGGNWTLTAQSQPHVKRNADSFEFRVPLQPDEEKVVTYTIRYTW